MYRSVNQPSNDMSQAQVCAQTITEHQSRTLMHDLISISLHCITFLRSIFDDEYYVDTSFIPKDTSVIEGLQRKSGKTRKVKTKTLRRGASLASDTFIDWIEQGIYQALDLNYVKAVQFSIFVDQHHPETMIECYLFTFDYINSSITVDSEVGVGVSTTKTSGINHIDAREQVLSIIKRLIILTQTLEPLPDQNYVSIRLLYNDSCPPHYQPPYFQDSSAMTPAFIYVDKSRKAIDSVGVVTTGFVEADITVIATHGQDLDATMAIDPFELHNEQDVSDMSIFSSIELQDSLDTGESDTSLNLKELLAPKNNHVEPTQVLSGQFESYTSQTIVNPSPNSILVCESGCKSQNTIKCTSCGREIIPVCYGNNFYNDLRIIKCYSCCFDPQQLDPDLILLMKLRFLWDYMLHNDFPTSTQMYKLLNLEVGIQTDDHVMETILNLFFRQNILVVNDKLLVESNSTDLVFGSGSFSPLTANIICGNKPLHSNREYFVWFVPRVKYNFPSLHYKQDIVKVTFPNFAATRKEAILHNLDKFKFLKSQKSPSVFHVIDDNDDPITSSSQLEFASSQPKATSNLHQFNLHPPNRVLTDEVEDLSFEDSLLFLSQSQLENVSRHKRPSNARLQSTKTKLRNVSINV